MAGSGTERVTACPLCGSTVYRRLGTKEQRRHGRDTRLDVARCSDCGLGFLEARPAGFDDDLYEYYAGRISLRRENLYSPITESRYLALLEQMARLTPGRKLLDVGCGQGQFVDVAGRNGWDAEGIDLAETAIELCSRFGVPARKLDFFDASLAPGSFDAVTMFELIEHVPRPDLFVRRAAELMRPGGLVFITTPNFGCLDRRLFGLSWGAIHVEHLTYFDPGTLRRLLSKAAPELELLELHTRNVSVRALRRLATPRQWLRSPQRSAASMSSATSTEAEDPGRAQLDLREKLERSALLRFGKNVLNRGLDRTQLGSAMTALLRRA